MDRIMVEVRAAEGGDDAKLLVIEQIGVYTRVCSRHSL
jgi:protein subunit release factor A